ncbi:hypothetical protein ACFLTB_01685, partial [Chloroflexota bacterium]
TEESIKNKNTLKVAGKVTGKLDDSMTRHGVSPGGLIIIMNDGTEHSEFVEDNLGSINNPMSFDECAAKFRECAPLALNPISADTTEKLIEMVRNLEELDDISDITKLLA